MEEYGRRNITLQHGLGFGWSILRLLPPASAKCPVKLHETLVFGTARLGECEFSGKERPLAIQDLEISRATSLVAQVGKSDGLLQVRDGILLSNADLMEFLVADQRIGDVAERALNGLPVRGQRLFVLRLR